MLTVHEFLFHTSLFRVKISKCAIRGVTMDKQIYWTSVAAFEIVPEGLSDNHEFEIEATEDEVNELMSLYNQLEQQDNTMFLKSANPNELYHDQNITSNLNYDEGLKKVYRLIYDLGKPKTKSHIMSMNIM